MYQTVLHHAYVKRHAHVRSSIALRVFVIVLLYSFTAGLGCSIGVRNEKEQTTLDQSEPLGSAYGCLRDL